MSKNNIRKIKCLGNVVSGEEKTLHPNDLTIIKSLDDNKYCPTFHFLFDKKYKIVESSEQPKLEDLKKHMQVPEVSLRKDDLLEIYDITNIDSLKSWIENNNTVLLFDTVNRVLNIWIKENLKSLKNYNNVLIGIIRNILTYHFKTDLKQIDRELYKYIEYWLKKKSYDDFNFNLIMDFKKFLSKKYDK